ncbi:hypothetical protein [Halalkalicoccus jeotgali]|uniref:Uncharacterized protein n=1 Tax=Halalkalicoccus jeotgali (strain DSM 18796 / CECT 7217 / JCM 14584 / KCTC 4019 / B3) TaxID=795797 RepID=D8J723_HALJB|nr:hypothetical protein [Halalkalicoccus jeotgali]ADJ15976.1 hypothetical protein HacjB3_12975 [Halalkalicoccus jeotgali B3]ELY38072.1 hypothetical protein C497_08179 [Halalkalicoccus jeotgali B3]
MAGDPFPTVASELLDEWTLDGRTTETVFSMSGLDVEGHTALYERADLRGPVRDATDGGLDQPWRFFFATRLTFDPPLMGIGPMAVFPMVLSNARRAFVADLEARGFEAVERGRTQRVRTDSGDRVRLTKYTARFAAGGVDAGIEAWFGVWTHSGEFRVAGGAYPVSGLPIDLDPVAYRAELLAILRSVE